MVHNNQYIINRINNFIMLQENRIFEANAQIKLSQQNNYKSSGYLEGLIGRLQNSIIRKRQAIEYLKKNLTDKNITITSISKRFKIHISF